MKARPKALAIQPKNIQKASHQCFLLEKKIFIQPNNINKP